MNLKNFELIYKENRVIIEKKSAVRQELVEILGDDNVSTKNIDKFAYSKDASLIGHNLILDGKTAGLPDFITFPETVSQISELLKLANREKIPVVPFGEGSGVVGGAIPIRGGIIIDMKKFSKIIEINERNLTVTVETGLNGMNLERYLNAKGYTCGHIPQSVYTSSVGGWIAHRAAGQFSTKYGKIEDIVLGMEVILPQGEVINFNSIVRKATGPQLDKLFIGNEGTLGVITKATLRIWPSPETRALISYAFPSFENSLEAVREILRENINPAVVRIYDKEETVRHFPDVEKAKDKVMVVFVCEGIERLVKLEAEITREKCEKNLGIDCGEHPVKHWFETRFKVTETSTSPLYKLTFDTIEVAASWENAANMYRSVSDKIKQIEGIIIFTAHVSHFYPNGVGIYFTFAGVPGGEETSFDFYRNIWNATMKEVIASGGSIAHHHGIGINRSHWMDVEWGKSMEIMREFKKVIDPNNIFNPGKVFENVWKGGKK